MLPASCIPPRLAPSLLQKLKVTLLVLKTLGVARKRRRPSKTFAGGDLSGVEEEGDADEEVPEGRHKEASPSVVLELAGGEGGQESAGMEGASGELGEAGLPKGAV